MSDVVGGMNQTRGENARDVAVRLEAETSGYNRGMHHATQATQTLVGVLITVEKTFGKLVKVAGQTSVGVGASLIGISGAASMMAARFEDAFARVEKTTGLAGNQLTKLGVDIRQLSTDIPVAANELAGLADLAGQLGVAAESVDDYAASAAKLGVATNISSTQAVSALSQLIGIFDLAEEQMDGLASSFSVLANRTRATEPDILRFATRVGGAAKAVGASADEIMAVGAAVTGMGVQVEAGGTAIQRVLLDMQEAAQSGGDKLRAFTEAMSMTNEEFRNIQASSPVELFRRLIGALADADDQAALLLRRLDIRDVRATQTLLTLAEATDELDDALGKSSAAFAEAEDIHKLAEIRFSTLTQQLRVFKQSLAEIWRAIGSWLVAPMMVAVKAMTGVVNLFNRIPEPAKNVMGYITAIGGSILTLGGIILTFMGTWHGLLIALAQAPTLLLWTQQSFQFLSETLARLNTVSATSAAATGAFGAAVQKIHAPLNRARLAVRQFGITMMSLGGKGIAWMFRDMVDGMMLLVRGTGQLIPALGMMAKSLARVGLVAGTIYAAFKTGQWIWRQMTQDVGEASDRLTQFAQSADLAYDPVVNLSDAMNQGADDALSFGKANEHLIEQLERLSRHQARDMIFRFGMNQIAGGADPDEVERQMQRLARHAGHHEITIDFATTNAGRVEQDLEDVDRRLEALMERADQPSIIDQAFNRPSLEIRERLEDEIEGAKSLAANEDFSGALARMFNVKEAIEQADIPEWLSDRLLSQWEKGLEDALPNIGDATRGRFRHMVERLRYIDASMPTLPSLVEQLGAGVAADEMAELEKRVSAVGISLRDELTPEEIEVVLGIMHDLSMESASARDQVGKIGEELNRIQKLWAAEPSEEGPEARRFREAAIQSAVAREGIMWVIDGLEQESDRLRKNGEEWTDRGHLVRQQLEELAEQQADMNIRNLEDEMNAMEAADAVQHLHRAITQYERDDTTLGRANLKAAREAQQEQIAGLENDLRGLLNQRDSMLERIEDIEKRHADRVADINERARERLRKNTKDHHERLEEMEESHTERLADLAEDRAERIEDAEEALQDRLDDAEEARQDRFEDAEESRRDQLEDASDSYQDTLERISEREEKAIEDMAEKQARAFLPDERIFHERTASAAALIRNMLDQNEILREMSAGLRQLRGMGLGQDFIEAMGLTDPENFGQVRQLLEDALADPSLIEEINRGWAEKGNIVEGLVDVGDRERVREEHDEMRQEAKEDYEETQADINESHREAVEDIKESHRESVEDIHESHRETVEEIKENYRESVEDAKEAHTEAVEKQKENYREQQAEVRKENAKQVREAREQTREQIAELRDEIADLARETGDSLEELIKKGFDSNIKGIQDVAAAARAAITAAQGDISRGMESLSNRRALRGFDRPSSARLTTPYHYGTLESGSEVGGHPTGRSESSGPAPGADVAGTLADDLARAIRSVFSNMFGGLSGFQHGGITTQEQLAHLSEGNNPEAIIPLNDRGADFFADVIKRMSGNGGSRGGDGVSLASAISDSADELTRAFRGWNDGLTEHTEELTLSTEELVRRIDNIEVPGRLDDFRGDLDISALSLERRITDIAVPARLDEFRETLNSSVNELEFATMDSARDIKLVTGHIEAAVRELADAVESAWTSVGGSAVGGVDIASGANAKQLQEAAKSQLAKFGWDESQMPALAELVQRESGWNPQAQNPNSTAFGLFQFLNSTWAGTGISKTADPGKQIEAGLRYIQSRYGSPEAALEHWKARKPIKGKDVGHWYQAGGIATGPTVAGIGESGDEAILPLDSARGRKAIAEAFRMASREPILGKDDAGMTGAMSQSYFNVEKVVSDDPDKMARSLRDKQRLRRLAGGRA